MRTPLLATVLRIPTSGARAIETFVIDDVRYLAVAQLAIDTAGQPADMNGGDSDAATTLVLQQLPDGSWARFQDLDVPGGEDAEFFTIGDLAFLAIASIRGGSGPYDYAQPQQIFEWKGERFEPFQSIPGYAAKQWRHFRAGARDFLALAQGVALPGHDNANQPSRIYEWTGETFERFQEVNSAWGYNWAHFRVGDSDYLAYADHVLPSLLLRWDGHQFVEHQTLVATSGRAFAHFTHDGKHYLVVACLQASSWLMRWEDDRFVQHQELPGLGGRELLVLPAATELHLIRINFITGTPSDPVSALDSHIYRWTGDHLDLVDTFPTNGGTDATAWTDPRGGVLVAVSNSLSSHIRFATDSVLYRFTPDPDAVRK